MPPAKNHAKRGPKTALEDDALRALLRADLAASHFTGEGPFDPFGRLRTCSRLRACRHRKIHARLHFVAGHKAGRNRRGGGRE